MQGLSVSTGMVPRVATPKTTVAQPEPDTPQSTDSESGDDVFKTPRAQLATPDVTNSLEIDSGSDSISAFHDSRTRIQILKAKSESSKAAEVAGAAPAEPRRMTLEMKRVAILFKLSEAQLQQFSDKQIAYLSNKDLQKYVSKRMLAIEDALKFDDSVIHALASEEVQHYLDSGVTDMRAVLSLNPQQIGNLSYPALKDYIGQDKNKFNFVASLSREQIRDLNYRQVRELIDKGAMTVEQGSNVKQEHLIPLSELNHRTSSEPESELAFSDEDMLRMDVQNILLSPDKPSVKPKVVVQPEPVPIKCDTENVVQIDDLLTGNV